MIIGAVIGGIVGGVISPILLSHYQEHRREKIWAKPRKELLLKMLSSNKHRFKSIERLSRTIGSTDQDCRNLLIELGARGAKLKSGKEAWALLSRAPLKEDIYEIEQSETED